MSTFTNALNKAQLHASKMSTNELLQSLLTGQISGVVGLVINELEERLELSEEKTDEAYRVYFN